MTEPNIAQTATLLGKTNVLGLTRDWQTLVRNGPENQSAFKVNSLFVTNRSPTNALDIDIRIGRDAPNSPTAIYPIGNFYQLAHSLAIPTDATVVAICRDNPIWLQVGDTLQIRAGADYRADAVCSYEYVSDTLTVPPPVNALPTPPQNLSVYTGYYTPGGQGARPTSFVLNWLPPASNGGSTLIDYDVYVQLYRPVTNLLPEAYSVITRLVKPASLRTALEVTTVPQLVDATGAQLLAAGTLSPILSQGTYYLYYFRFFVVARNLSGADLVTGVAATGFTTFEPHAPPVIQQGAPGDGEVELTWTQALPPAATPLTIGGTEITMPLNTYVGANIRWTRDNGVTWEPNLSGLLFPDAYDAYATASTPIQATINGLQNGVIYRFSVQTIMNRRRRSNDVTEEQGNGNRDVLSPWSKLSGAVIPLPGATSSQQLRAMFVSYK